MQQLTLERELRAAVEHNEFVMYFQPEFSMVDGRIVGAEALLRWNHPDRGITTAAEFIAVAEQSGLIDEIGRTSLRDACVHFAELTRRTGEEHLVLRCNISAREFARPELLAIVHDALELSGLDPTRLCLEMTETTLMDAPDVALTTMTSLNEIGVTSAIDDFGTGYSSLSYLKRFPVKGVKIDRAFVSDIVPDRDSRMIVESITRLAEAMGLETVAEGVERVEQMEVLRSLGCNLAQGHLVAPAVSADELAGLLAAHRHRPVRVIGAS